MFTEAQELAYKAGLVRFHRDNKVIGAGFYVNHGYVLTCAHIVTQCLLNLKKPQGIAVETVAGKPIKLDFPFVAKGQFQNAEVVPILWRLNDQDLALLKVLDALPQGVDASPIRDSTYYRGDRYHVYGFPDGHPDGLESRGELLSDQSEGWIQMEDTKAEGVPIEPGFSGAPVWDAMLGTIVGMTVARDKDREEAKVSFMIPYQTLKPALAAIDLFALLLSNEMADLPDWQSAFNFVQPKLQALQPDPPTHLEAAIVQVQNLPPPESGKPYRAIDWFVCYLSVQSSSDPYKLKLCEWLKQQASVPDRDALLAEVRQKLAAISAKSSVPHLLFWVQGEFYSDRYWVQAYLVKDRQEHHQGLTLTPLKAPAHYLRIQTDQKPGQADQKVDWAQLPDILRDCLEESVAQLPHQDGLPNLQVEIFLPLDKLGRTVEQEDMVEFWAAERKSFVKPVPERMGHRYQVVLRSSERLNPQICPPQMQAIWRGKWQTLRQVQAQVPCAGLSDGHHPNGTPKSLEELSDALSDSSVVGLFLTHPPQPFVSDEEPGPLAVLIGTGAPVAIWTRRSLPEPGQVCNEVLNCCLSELPGKVKALRVQTKHQRHLDPPPLGQHIGLIWEDPDLIPQTARLQPPT